MIDHEELWQPAWGIRTGKPLELYMVLSLIMILCFIAIIGLQGFFPLKGEAALGVGALDIPVPERKRLAKL